MKNSPLFPISGQKFIEGKESIADFYGSGIEEKYEYACVFVAVAFPSSASMRFQFSTTK